MEEEPSVSSLLGTQQSRLNTFLALNVSRVEFLGKDVGSAGHGPRALTHMLWAPTPLDVPITTTSLDAFFDKGHSVPMEGPAAASGLSPPPGVGAGGLPVPPFSALPAVGASYSGISPRASPYTGRLRNMMASRQEEAERQRVAVAHSAPVDGGRRPGGWAPVAGVSPATQMLTGAALSDAALMRVERAEKTLERVSARS